MASFVDRLLDTTIVGGYSRVGFDIRSRTSEWERFSPDALVGRRIVVTGPTSGIGLAAVHGLARLGASIVLVGRDEARTRSVAKGLGETAEVVVCDMADLDDVNRASSMIMRAGTPDLVVHNAGALLRTCERTLQDFETTMAVHVLAPHLMTRLVPSARSIWVASGGMYAAPLIDPRRRDPMSPATYDGTKQYASAKRMQVALIQDWSTRDESRWFAAMHPGWADTPGVRNSLPGFAKVTRPILRSPDQGADTIVWLAATARQLPSGDFWCDRESRPRHRLGSTRRSDTEDVRRAVVEWADRLTDPWT